jgi:hypothetical protein
MSPKKNHLTSIETLKKKYPGATFVKTWDELKEYVKNNPSKTHRIDFGDCNGFILKKNTDKFEIYYYLSTHTFYEKDFHTSTEKLQKSGFNVVLDNWDEVKEV